MKMLPGGSPEQNQFPVQLKPGDSQKPCSTAFTDRNIENSEVYSDDLAQSVTLSCCDENSRSDGLADQSPEPSSHSELKDPNLSTWARISIEKSEEPGCSEITKIFLFYACCWDGCAENFPLDEHDALREHVASHGSEFLEQLPFEQETASCQIDGCTAAPFVPSENGRKSYMRHLSFHHYHATRMMSGLCRILQLCGYAKEGMDSKLLKHVEHGDTLPELETVIDNMVCGSKNRTWANSLQNDGDALRCAWADCSVEFEEPDKLVAHVLEHVKCLHIVYQNAQKQFQCEWKGCTATVARKSDMRKHSVRHVGQRQYACPKCGVFFDVLGRLKDHVLRGISQPASHVCFYCRAAFATEKLLQMHTKKHVNRFKCSKCEFTAHGAAEVRRHVFYRHSNEDDRPFKCTQCTKGFVRSNDLQTHMAVHFDFAPYECGICGKTFKWKRWLKHHERSHNDETILYACHVCAAEFRQVRSCSDHLKEQHKIEIQAVQRREIAVAN